jgi:hypothetical protein
LALVGFTLGYAASCYLAFRLVQRSPRVVGGAVVFIAVLVALSLLADSSGWDWLYLWVPGVLLGVAAIWFARRTRVERRPLK